MRSGSSDSLESLGPGESIPDQEIPSLKACERAVRRPPSSAGAFTCAPNDGCVRPAPAPVLSIPPLMYGRRALGQYEHRIRPVDADHGRHTQQSNVARTSLDPSHPQSILQERTLSTPASFMSPPEVHRPPPISVFAPPPGLSGSNSVPILSRNPSALPHRTNLSTTSRGWQHLGHPVIEELNRRISLPLAQSHILSPSPVANGHRQLGVVPRALQPQSFVSSAHNPQLSAKLDFENCVKHFGLEIDWKTAQSSYLTNSEWMASASVAGQVFGVGTGRSKKEACQAASVRAVTWIRNHPDALHTLAQRYAPRMQCT